MHCVTPLNVKSDPDSNMHWRSRTGCDISPSSTGKRGAPWTSSALSISLLPLGGSEIGRTYQLPSTTRDTRVNKQTHSMRVGNCIIEPAEEACSTSTMRAPTRNSRKSAAGHKQCRESSRSMRQRSTWQYPVRYATGRPGLTRSC